MTWQPELEFCMSSLTGIVDFVYFDKDKKCFEPEGKKFTIKNSFLDKLFNNFYGVCYHHLELNHAGLEQWAIIENVMFRFLDCDYRYTDSIDKTEWLCEVIAYLDVK